MAPHSSTLAWKIPWMEEPGRLQSMGSLRVGQNWVTSLSLFTFMHWRRKWQSTPVFLPGESQGQRSLVGCRLWGRTRLRRLSSSSSICIFTGLPRRLSGKESACQCRKWKRLGFNPWVRKIPWSRKWHPTPVFLPGESHGQRSLMGYSLWGRKEWDVTEWWNTNMCVYIHTSCVFYSLENPDWHTPPVKLVEDHLTVVRFINPHDSLPRGGATAGWPASLPSCDKWLPQSRAAGLAGPAGTQIFGPHVTEFTSLWLWWVC